MDEQLVEEISREKTFNKFQSHLKFQKFSLNASVIGVSTLILLGVLYVLTRPCVIDNCQEIGQVRALTQNALSFLETRPSTAAIVAARQQLGESIQILKTIPWWSKYYPEAAVLIQDFQNKFNDLDAIINAIKATEKTLALIEKSPLSVEQLQEIAQILKEAIASLNQVSFASNLAPLTNHKIQEYQRDLVYIDQRLLTEQQAVENLQSAKEAANLAKRRETNAQSLTDWRSLHASWQEAIQRLEAILPGTTVYQDARQLRGIYLPRFVKAETRKKQEEFASFIHQQATQEAKLAKEAESKNQWTQAVTHWQNALQYIKQVPKNSFQYARIEPVITTYTLSLNLALTKQKEAIEEQKLMSNLNKVCLGKTKICKYRVDKKNNSIKVTLISSYLQQLWNAALQARAQGNLQSQIELLNHISKLEQSLQTISNNTGRRIEVYNSKGEVMTIYEAGGRY